MRLNVLGPMQVIVGGSPTAIGPPKQRALLALLAINADRVLPSDLIVDQLWSGHAPASATGSLQAYVSNLRRVLEPARRPGTAAAVLVSAAHGYGLITGTIDLDSREFQALITLGAEQRAAGQAVATVDTVERALAMWRGSAYADVRLEGWARSEIDRLEQLRLDAIEVLADAELALDRLGAVVDRLEPFVVDNPLRERAWELLVLAHYRSNRQSAALDRLRRVRRVLADELGVDPGPRLRRLESAVLGHRDDLLRPSSGAGVTDGQAEHDRTGGTRAHGGPGRHRGIDGPRGYGGHGRSALGPAPAPFIGRTAELEALGSARTAAGARAQVVLVDGEPGVDKTWLVRRFAAGVAEPVGWGSSPSHERAPALWPWEQALGQLAATATSAADSPAPTGLPPEVSELLEGRASAPVHGEAHGARLRFFDAVARYLAGLGPAVIVLEDLQNADDGTLRLLIHLAGGGGPGLLIVGTLRRHESATISDTLAALARLGAHRLTVPPMSADEVRALVSAVTGTGFGAEPAAQLRRRTGGNPFFVAEVARADGPLPVGVLDLVSHRVHGLGPTAVRVLEVAAVIGQDLDPEVLAEAAGLPVLDLVGPVESALAAGLLQESARPGRYEFAHALVADALLAGRSRLWRGQVHELVAAALTRRGGERAELTPALARHWLAAAEVNRQAAGNAMEYCSRAARSALDRHAPDDAAAWWQDGLAAAELASADAAACFPLALGLAESRYAAGRFDEGYADVRRALHLATDLGSVVAAADIAMGQSGWLPFRPGLDVSELAAALERALSELPPTGHDAALGLAIQAVVLAHLDPGRAVEAASAAAVAAARESADPDLIARVMHLRLIALHGPDFIEQRAEAAAVLGDLPGISPRLRAIAGLSRVAGLVEKGEMAEGEATLEGVEALVQEVRDPTLALQVAGARAGIALLRGSPGAEPTEGERPVSAPEGEAGAGIGYFEVGRLAYRAERTIQQGQLVSEIPWLEEVVRRTGEPGFGYLLALALAERGDRERARVLLTAPGPTPRDYRWATTMLARLQAAISLGERDVVREGYAAFRPFAGLLVVSGTCTTISGAYDGHLGEAMLALGETVAARSHLSAAIDQLERAGSGYWLQRARLAFAKCS